jgi:hypothetical protein
MRNSVRLQQGRSWYVAYLTCMMQDKALKQCLYVSICPLALKRTYPVDLSFGTNLSGSVNSCAGKETRRGS